MATLSSATVRGGVRTATQLMNIGVPSDFARTDLETYADEVAASIEMNSAERGAPGFNRDGIVLLTAADVSNAQRHATTNVTVDATVGVSKPTWAADPDGGWNEWSAGTINLVIQLDVALDQAAAVNAVMTATEAKTQAMIEAGIPGTGTASDAIVLAWPIADGVRVERFAGPRSNVGSQVAIAVHAAITRAINTHPPDLSPPISNPPNAATTSESPR